MSTIDGYEADPNEADAVLDSFLDEEDRRDPTLLYLRATRLEALFREVLRRVAAERAKAVARLHTDMRSLARVAEHLGVSRPRAQQLVERGRAEQAAERT